MPFLRIYHKNRLDKVTTKLAVKNTPKNDDDMAIKTPATKAFIIKSNCIASFNNKNISVN